MSLPARFILFEHSWAGIAARLERRKGIPDECSLDRDYKRIFGSKTLDEIAELGHSNAVDVIRGLCVMHPDMDKIFEGVFRAGARCYAEAMEQSDKPK
ncbi:MAG TPA: hypothetical protein VJJ24_02035 [Candidatus Paceibacterota bacterium]